MNRGLHCKTFYNCNLYRGLLFAIISHFQLILISVNENILFMLISPPFSPIHNPSFSSWLMNGLNKLECFRASVVRHSILFSPYISHEENEVLCANISTGIKIVMNARSFKAFTAEFVHVSLPHSHTFFSRSFKVCCSESSTLSCFACSGFSPGNPVSTQLIDRNLVFL